MSTRNTILYRKLFNNSQRLSLFRLNKWPESGPNKHFVASNAIFDTYTRKISRRQWFVYRNRLFLLLSKLNHTDQRKRASSFDNKWNWLSFPSAVWKGLPLSSFKLKDSVWPCKFGEIQIEIKKTAIGKQNVGRNEPDRCKCMLTSERKQYSTSDSTVLFCSFNCTVERCKLLKCLINNWPVTTSEV